MIDVVRFILLISIWVLIWKAFSNVFNSNVSNKMVWRLVRAFVILASMLALLWGNVLVGG